MIICYTQTVPSKTDGNRCRGSQTNIWLSSVNPIEEGEKELEERVWSRAPQENTEESTYLGSYDLTETEQITGEPPWDLT